MTLHQLGKICQLRYMEQQCNEVLTHLDALVRNTLNAAPVRLSRPYPLERSDHGKCWNREHRIERAIWRQYGRNWRPGSSPFLPGVCSFLQSFQVMLRHENGDVGWGEIDLLGTTPAWLTAVVELKDGYARDTPLRFLAEAAAYGVAIRKAWADPNGLLRGPWTELMRRRSCLPLALPAILPDCPLICAAPAAYWDRVLGRSGLRGTVRAAAWPIFGQLVEALHVRGYPVSFVSLTNAGLDAERLPENVQAAPILLEELHAVSETVVLP
jgi:hypothetical protein